MTQGYIFDWVVVLAWIIIANTIPLSAIKPVTRFFLPTDATLSYPLMYTNDPVVSDEEVWVEPCMMNATLLSLCFLACTIRGA